MVIINKNKTNRLVLQIYLQVQNFFVSLRF